MGNQVLAHVLVSRIHAALAILFLVAATITFSLLANRDSPYPNIGYVLIAYFSAPMACIHGLISLGAKLGAKWAKILSILVGCGLLFLIPLGTVIGIILIVKSLAPWEKTGVTPLTFNSIQQNSQIDTSEADQISELLRSSTPEAWAQLPHQDRFDFITRHLQAAQGFGITTMHEKSFYCMLALMYGEDFSSQPAWRNGLDQIRSGTLTLQKLTHQIEEKNE